MLVLQGVLCLPANNDRAAGCYCVVQESNYTSFEDIVYKFIRLRRQCTEKTWRSVSNNTVSSFEALLLRSADRRKVWIRFKSCKLSDKKFLAFCAIGPWPCRWQRLFHDLTPAFFERPAQIVKHFSCSAIFRSSEFWMCMWAGEQRNWKAGGNYASCLGDHKCR